MNLFDHMNDPGATPKAFHTWCDFLRQDDVSDGGAFDATVIGTGTVATNAANGGICRISGAATTDNDGGQIQALAGHVCTSGKFLGFKARAELGESTSANVATESDLYIGLLPVDTSIVASLPADGIYFAKADGATDIVATVRVGSSNVFTQTLDDAADSDAHAWGIAVRPNGSESIVEFIRDGVVVAQASDISLPASSVVLTPTIAFQSGDNTGTKYVDVDYVGSYQER